MAAGLAFFFLVPAFYSGTAYGPWAGNSGPVWTSYSSLGCMYLGIGDIYYNPGPSFHLLYLPGSPFANERFVFSCSAAAAPPIPW
jgi:hypothetical protein